MEKQKKGALKFISSLIVDYRFIIFLLFAAAAVYCFLSLGKVRINSDLTAFLPDSMETRKGLTVMEEEFTSFASSDFMLSNVTFDTAQNIADQIKEIEHVDEVTFDDTSAHYTGASALITVSFDGGSESKGVVDAEKKIEELISPYDHYISTDVGVDYVASLANEMIFIMAIAVAVIAGVLIFTSRSYFEVVIFAIVFVFSGLLNMGTNYWLGEISSITNTIAVIMQLALAIDYAIIFAHRYQDEAAANPDSRAALIEALSKSIVEISSSSMPTGCGPSPSSG